MIDLNMVLVLSGFFALVCSGVFGRAFLEVVNERKWRRSFRSACKRYGLRPTVDGEVNSVSAAGEVAGRRVTIGYERVDGMPTTRLLVGASLPADVAIDGGGLREDASEVADSYLGPQFSVCGQALHTAALLDAASREAIRHACVLGVRVFKGNIIFQAQRVLSTEELTERIEAMLKLAAALDSGQTFAERLLAIVTDDPEPYPRRRAAELLESTYPGAPETSEAAVFSRTAEDPWLRLWGYRRLKEAGVEMLLGLVRDGSLPAELRAQATRALLDTPKGAAVGGPELCGLVRKLNGKVLRAALEVLEKLHIVPQLTVLENRYASIGNVAVRVALVSAMKQHEEESLGALRRLATAFSTPAEVKVAALGGLAEFGKREDLAVVAEQRASLRPSVVAAAMDALERLKVRLGAGGLAVLHDIDLTSVGGLSPLDTASLGAVSTVEEGRIGAISVRDDIEVAADA